MTGPGPRTPESALKAAADHLRAGRLDEAERLYRQVAESAPANGAALFWMGVIANWKGDRTAAADLLRKATAAEPDNADYHCACGAVCLALERTQEGLGHLRRALEIDPDHAETLERYGVALHGLNSLEEAVIPFERLARVRPEAASARFKLALTLTALRRYPEAATAFRAGLALKPDNAKACHVFARVLQVLGDFEGAADLFRKALALRPGDAAAHYELARCKKYAAGDPHIAEMEALLAGGGLEGRDRAIVHFALAKVHDDAGLYDDAFRHGRAANELLDPGYDAEAHARRVSDLIRCFDESLLARAGEVGVDDGRHAFVVGMPRSGTTLVDQIVSSHPKVHAAGEKIFFHSAAEILAQHLNSGLSYPDCVRDAEPEAVARLAKVYQDVFNGLPPEIARITNKFPENFRVLGLIALMFPRSRVIHCRRDPMDLCVSCFFQDLPRDFHPYSFDLGALGHYYMEYERLMAHWRKVLPTPMIEVSYEDLIGNQETESRRLVEFLELEWDDRCLEFQKNETAVGTASLWQVRQPVYTTSLGRWRHYGAHLGPLKKALGRG